MPDVRYKRILLKMGGEALATQGGFGIDPVRASEVAQVVKDVHDLSDLDGVLGDDTEFALPGQRLATHFQKYSLIADIGHNAQYLTSVSINL